jgi:hypothetical protein
LSSIGASAISAPSSEPQPTADGAPSSHRARLPIFVGMHPIVRRISCVAVSLILCAQRRGPKLKRLHHRSNQRNDGPCWPPKRPPRTFILRPRHLGLLCVTVTAGNVNALTSTSLSDRLRLRRHASVAARDIGCTRRGPAAAILGDGMRSDQSDRIEPLDFGPDCMDGAHRRSRS